MQVESGQIKDYLSTCAAKIPLIEKRIECLWEAQAPFIENPLSAVKRGGLGDELVRNLIIVPSVPWVDEPVPPLPFPQGTRNPVAYLRDRHRRPPYQHARVHYEQAE